MAKKTKRLLCAIVSLVMVFMLLPQGIWAAGSNGAHRHGDMNADGAVDQNDAVYLLYHSVWPEAYPLTHSGNLDQKGEVDRADAIWLLNAVNGVSGYSLKSLVEKTIDSTTHAVCEGTKIEYTTCIDGEDVWNWDWELACDMVEQESRIEKDAYGDEYEVYIEKCSKCGLTREISDYELVDEDACTSTPIQKNVFLLNDAVILSDTETMGGTDRHPANAEIDSKKLTLAENGICDTTIVHQSCFCGEADLYDVSEGCDWIWDYNIDNHNEVYVCTVCGAVKTLSWSSEEVSDCTRIEKTVVTVTQNDAEVYTYTTTKPYASHENKATAWELLGESCNDGVAVTYTCKNCGEVTEDTAFGHVDVIETETIDLSAAGLCTTEMVLTECACGVLKSATGNECEMQWMEETPEGYSYARQCVDCGAVYLTSEEQGEADENCNSTYTEKLTIMKDGVEIVTYVCYAYTGASHDWEITVELDGESCEDGYTRTATCARCGLVEEPAKYYEHNREITTVDTSDKGVCFTSVQVLSCPCGQEQYYNLNQYCDWDWENSTFEDGKNVVTCLTCGAKQYEAVETTEKDAECRIYIKSTELIKNSAGEDVITLVRSWSYEEHDYEVTGYTLNGETCEDGGTVSRTCKTCGYVEEGEVINGHEFAAEWVYTLKGESCEDGWTANRVCEICGYSELWNEGTYHVTPSGSVKLTDISGENICYDTLEEGTCLCGEKHFYLYGEKYCDWRWQSSENGVEISKCSVCQATRTMTETAAPKDENCVVQVTRSFVFTDKDGKTVVSYTTTGTRDEHVFEVTGYTLNGETCEDGVTVSRTCKDCGKVEEGATIERHEYVNVTVTDTTGKTCFTSVTQKSCACGAEKDYTIEGTECAWEYQGMIEDGVEKYVCSVCNAVQYRTEQFSDKDVENGCRAIVSYINTIKDSAGNDVVTYTRSYYTSHHDYVETYDLGSNTSCEDGVTVNIACKDCGYADSYEATYHNYDYTTYVISLNDESVGCTAGWTAGYVCKTCGNVDVTREGTDHTTCKGEKIDTSDKGVCFASVNLESCACGGFQTFYYERGVTQCDWGDPETLEDGTEVRTCKVCEAKWYYSVENSEPDADGNYHMVATYRIVNKAGEDAVTYYYAGYRTVN